MRVVVADTGPLNYLVLIGEIDVLPALFDRVIAPRAVFDELADPATPASVRAWIAWTPGWFEIHADPAPRREVSSTTLGAGERAVIALAVELGADLVLMDDREGGGEARRNGLAATGTLGVLDLAARRGLIDLADAFTRLKATSFYYSRGLLEDLLAAREREG